jgi:hypothetical protein
VRKHLACDSNENRIRIAWLSFQPDGSISFGLHDKTFISPALKIRQGIWNAYNRRRLKFEIPSDPSALIQIQNPHFTYHPPGLFHLTANKGSAVRQDIFRGAARIAVALDQRSVVPWIKVITALLAQLSSGGIRPDPIDVEEMVMNVPSDQVSACVAVDFVRPECQGQIEHKSCWFVPWHDLALKITLSFTWPSIPMLTWRHDS